MVIYIYIYIYRDITNNSAIKNICQNNVLTKGHFRFLLVDALLTDELLARTLTTQYQNVGLTKTCMYNR